MEKSRPPYPVLKLGNDKIETSLEHKQLVMTLDHKLDFQSHILRRIQTVARYAQATVRICYYGLYISKVFLTSIVNNKFDDFFKFLNLRFHFENKF